MKIQMTKAEAEAEYERLESLTPDQKRFLFSSVKDYIEALCKCLDVTMTPEEKEMLLSLKK